MTNVSHTHCGPWIEGNLIGMAGRFPPEGLRKAAVYRRQLEEKMIRAAANSLRALAPATLSRNDAVGLHFESVPTITNRWPRDLRARAGRVRGKNAPGGRVPTSSQLTRYGVRS